MPDYHHMATVNRYKQLVKSMNELITILNPELVYEYTANTAIKLCEAETGWILIPDPINHTLNIAPGISFENPNNTVPSVPIEGSLEGWVYLNQQPFLRNEASPKDMGVWINPPGSTTKSALIIPVSIKSKRIFILEVVNKLHGEFNQEDLEILTAFGRHAAICIDKSHRSFQSDLIPELVHELRTPLAALNTALHLLQRTDLPGDKREHISKVIQAEFNRLADLTTSYLDYSRLESGKEKYKQTRFDLSQLISDSVEVMQMQCDCKDLKIFLDLPSGPIFITADEDKIKQVVLNLLNNAIKYNRAGGDIHISANESPMLVSFSLRDSGQGIPSEHIPHIFERFYRLPSTERKVKGTGLGLAICKQIVEAHNGRIEVSSTEGQGSTFTVYLPITVEKLAVPV